MTDAKPKARTDRLKAALRENLKRRKVQARGREATAPPERSESDDRPISAKHSDD
jgi:hypothetical protein